MPQAESDLSRLREVALRLLDPITPALEIRAHSGSVRVCSEGAGAARGEREVSKERGLGVQFLAPNLFGTVVLFPQQICTPPPSVDRLNIFTLLSGRGGENREVGTNQSVSGKGGSRARCLRSSLGSRRQRLKSVCPGHPWSLRWGPV